MFLSIGIGEIGYAECGSGRLLSGRYFTQINMIIETFDGMIRAVGRSHCKRPFSSPLSVHRRHNFHAI